LGSERLASLPSAGLLNDGPSLPLVLRIENAVRDGGALPATAGNDLCKEHSSAEPAMEFAAEVWQALR